MVAKYLKPNTVFSNLFGHQLLLQEETSIAPQLQIYAYAYAKDLAAFQTNPLQLNKVMQNIKKDNISFKNALDRLVYSQKTFHLAATIFQRLNDNVIHNNLYIYYHSSYYLHLVQTTLDDRTTHGHSRC